MTSEGWISQTLLPYQVNYLLQFKIILMLMLACFVFADSEQIKQDNQKKLIDTKIIENEGNRRKRHLILPKKFNLFRRPRIYHSYSTYQPLYHGFDSFESGNSNGGYRSWRSGAGKAVISRGRPSYSRTIHKAQNFDDDEISEIIEKCPILFPQSAICEECVALHARHIRFVEGVRHLRKC